MAVSRTPHAVTSLLLFISSAFLFLLSIHCVLTPRLRCAAASSQFKWAQRFYNYRGVWKTRCQFGSDPIQVGGFPPPPGVGISTGFSINMPSGTNKVEVEVEVRQFISEVSSSATFTRIFFLFRSSRRLLISMLYENVTFGETAAVLMSTCQCFSIWRESVHTSRPVLCSLVQPLQLRGKSGRRAVGGGEQRWDFPFCLPGIHRDGWMAERVFNGSLPDQAPPVRHQVSGLTIAATFTEHLVKRWEWNPVLKGTYYAQFTFCTSIWVSTASENSPLFFTKS